MKTKISYLLLFILFSLKGSSQSCLPNGIVFTNQEQIDSFSINYPNCTVIEGDVIIEFGSQEVNLLGLLQLEHIDGHVTINEGWFTNELEGLNNLESIGGNLVINQVQTIAFQGLENLSNIQGSLVVFGGFINSFSGLENLTTIGNNLRIEQAFFYSLTGLENLAHIGGDLEVSNIFDLFTFEGLETLDTIGGDLIIHSTDIFELEGLENLQSIQGGIKITNAFNLSSLQSLQNITTLGGDLRITDCFLPSLEGLENLQSIHGNLYLVSLFNAFDLDALSNLELVTDSIVLFNNFDLMNLFGLENVNPDSLDFLWLEENYLLSACHTDNICTYLVNGGPHLISGNDEYCATANSLVGACSAPCSVDPVVLSRQGQIDSFPLLYPECYEILEGLYITSSLVDPIYNLDSLIQLTSIINGLFILDNPELTSLHGLENVTSLSQELLIENNDALLNCEGLSNLTVFNGYVTLKDNDNLQTLEGLVFPSSVKSVLVEGNLALQDLKAFETVEAIEGSLNISNNDLLQNVDDLSNLTFLGNDLTILNNGGLENLDGLSTSELLFGFHWITIVNNSQLNNISGIENYDANFVSNLFIESNPLLNICNIDIVCNYLSLGKNGSFENNAPGCNSQNEVEIACGLIDALNDQRIDPIQVLPNPGDGLYTFVGLSASEASYSIYNALGENIAQGKKNSNNYKLDLTHLPDGIYFLNLITEDWTYFTSVIKSSY